MKHRPAISVVIPFYNEQDSIVPLFTEIEQALSGTFDYELIAVDDGSSDETGAVMADAARNLQTVRLVRLACNRGQSTALANGIHAARAPLIATLDGDGQNPPTDIVKLLGHYRQAIDEGAVAIVGWRQHRNDTRVRRMSSRIANRFRGAVLGDRCPDTGCGLKIFARDDFLALPKFRNMHRFLPALFVRAGVRVISVPVTHRQRQLGRSKYGVRNRLWAGLVDLAGVYWLTRRACRVDYEITYETTDV